MQIPNEHRDDLTEIEQTLAIFDAKPSDDYFGAQLMRAGLERRRTQVLAKRMEGARRTRESLDLSLLSHTRTGADISLVATVLKELQEAIHAIAQSLREQPTTRGSVPVGIRKAVHLRVAFALPGSLALRLVPAQPPQPSLFEDEDQPLLDVSIDELLTLFERSAQAETTPAILEQVARIGPRATVHLEKLARVLIRHHSTVSLQWRAGKTVRKTIVAEGTAAHLARLLQQIDATEHDIVVEARLVGGSLLRRMFELELEDGTVIRGKVAADALPELEALFGSHCTAEVSVHEASLPGGETKKSYFLVSLRE